MMPWSFLKQQGVLQLFIWLVVLTHPRCMSAEYLCLLHIFLQTVIAIICCKYDTDFICHVQASVFVQSHVQAHVELMWLLSAVTPIGWLNKMIQFKEKSRKTVCHWCITASSPSIPLSFIHINCYYMFYLLMIVPMQFDTFRIQTVASLCIMKY